MADQFGASTQQNLLPGGDGRKLFGWNLLNSAHATGADVNITNPGYVSIYPTGVSSPTGATFNVPFVYQNLSGDFDVNIGTNANNYPFGLIARDPNASAGEDWLGWSNIPGDMAYSKNTTNGSTAQYGASALFGYFRLARSGAGFTTYYSGNGTTWTQHQQFTRNDFAVDIQVGIYAYNPTAVDYFQGTYTMTPNYINVRQFPCDCMADGGVNYCRLAGFEMSQGYINNPLTEGQVAMYYGNVLASVFLELINVLYTLQWPQEIKQPFVPEIVHSVVMEISEGFNATRSFNTKIVDSGIEALQAIRSSISGIAAGQVQLSEIFEGFAKASYLLSSMAEGINAAQSISNEIVDSTVFAQYIKNMLTQLAIKRNSPAWDITLDGTTIKKYIKDVTLTKSESEAVNHLELQIAGLSLFDKCNPINGYGMERIVLTIGGETYRFFIETREISETYDKSGLTVWGRQKSGLLAEGYAQKLTQTYSDRYAAAIAIEIAENCGVTLYWNAPNYWINSFSADAFPIDAIIQLAAAIGAIVQTTPDGSIVVRHKYPVVPSNLPTPNIAVIFDRDNILGLDLSEEQALYSKVTVNIKQDTTASYNFSSEVAPTCVTPGGSATIKIYIPNENIKYDLKATPSGKIREIVSGIVETLTETIILTDGSGTTAKTIFKVISYQLYSCNSAHTEIKYTIGTKEITVDNDTCAICEIQYETLYDTWEISCDVAQKIGVCLVTYTDDAMPSSVTVMMGDGGRAAADITNDLVYGENQAKTVAEAFLDDNFYRKKKYQLDVPYLGCQTGQIASVADDRHNVYGVGIIREASLNIKLNGAAAMIKENIVLYCYEEDGSL
ncbi:MAG: hypothetical protein HQK98_08375 [Nitrospirae bacterium]|nr:hypothetical protein [Nitrospirota bacterium]